MLQASGYYQSFTGFFFLLFGYNLNRHSKLVSYNKACRIILLMMPDPLGQQDSQGFFWHVSTQTYKRLRTWVWEQHSDETTDKQRGYAPRDIVVCNTM